jgi:hypothetical protein
MGQSTEPTLVRKRPFTLHYFLFFYLYFSVCQMLAIGGFLYFTFHIIITPFAFIVLNY